MSNRGKVSGTGINCKDGNVSNVKRFVNWTHCIMIAAEFSVKANYASTMHETVQCMKNKFNCYGVL